MLKRCLLAVIVALLVAMTSSQIASADIPIDWSKVQRISSATDLARYMESKRRAGETIIPVILTNGLTVTGNELTTLCPSSVVSWKHVSNDGKNTCIIYTLMDYPGTKVANAYRSGNTIWLTAEEKRLYDEAVKIINEAKKKNGMMYQEVYIYEQIMHRSQYLTGDMSISQQRFTTAMGVLLDGKANCQGYADAFYMLGRMMDWNVNRMSGKAGGGAHAWNTITFDDGKTYFVDATWGDSSIENGGKKYNGYIYLNAPVEIIQETHSWEGSLAPTNLQPSVDNRYSYCFFDSNLARRSNVLAGMEFLAQKLSQNTWASVMVPKDEKYLPKDVMQRTLEKEVLSKCNKGFTYLYWTHGKYLFIDVRLK